MNKSATWLVALSGGADSVALLLMLKEKGYANIHALHCNFHLRGEESDRDQKFCEELCRRLIIAIHVKHFDTLQEAKSHNESIEMAARRLRYGWFSQMQHELHAQGIFVAHHQDDQAETVLMNLLRGTGLNGLKGMSPDSTVDGLRIIRPLLSTSKQQILDYLSERKQNFVTDSTNLKRNALRNKIRLDVIPLLKELNPSVVECIARTAENIRLETDNDREPELFARLSKLGFSRQQILDINQHISNESSGLVWHSHTNTVYINRGEISIEDKLCTNTVPDIIVQDITSEEGITFTPDCAYVDADTLHGNLHVRHYNNGERFQPNGMNGNSKLVSDYLTDRKVPLSQKQRQLVVSDDNSIVWIPTHTTDHRHRITPETKHIIKVTLSC